MIAGAQFGGRWSGRQFGETATSRSCGLLRVGGDPWRGGQGASQNTRRAWRLSKKDGLAGANKLPPNLPCGARGAILGPEMLNDEKGSDEVSDLEFEEQCNKLDQIDRRRLWGKRYTDVIWAQDARDVARQLSQFNGDWVFRGQKDTRWRLTPSIERCAPNGLWHQKEDTAYQVFRNRAPVYMREGPELSSHLAWLATMQHHGGPTRLLDWTEDPSVAAFFAVAEADRKGASAVWAINYAAITEETRRLLSLAPGTFEDDRHFVDLFFRKTWPPVVMQVNTSQPSERQQKQKGLFLCSNATHWGYGFETSLKNVLQHRPKSERRWLCKIKIPPDARDELLTELLERGVTYETLFPDLSGLGKSIGIIASVKSDCFTDYYPEFRSRGSLGVTTFDCDH